MAATEVQVQAAQEALGCRADRFALLPGEPVLCATHATYRERVWTDRGCPIAASVADAVASAA